MSLCTHSWDWVRDWDGDPSIPNGTRDLSHWECKLCVAEHYGPNPPEESESGEQTEEI